MEILHSDDQGMPVLRVMGEVDHFSAPRLQAAIDGGFDQCGSAVTVDLTDCPFMDSGGLSVLLFAVSRQESPNWLGVKGASPNLLRIFRTVGLTSNPHFKVLDAPAGDGAAGGGVRH